MESGRLLSTNIMHNILADAEPFGLMIRNHNFCVKIKIANNIRQTGEPVKESCIYQVEQRCIVCSIGVEGVSELRSSVIKT